MASRGLSLWLVACGALACNALGGIEEGVPVEQAEDDFEPVLDVPEVPPPLPQGPETCDDNPFLTSCDAENATTSQGDQLGEEQLGDGLVLGAPLLIDSGSVSAPGIDAAMTTFKSPLGSVIAPDCDGDQTCFQADGEICVRGSTSRVPALDDFSSYWGAMLQMAFAAPWDRATRLGSAKGISFRIRGRAIPVLRLQVEGADTAGALEFYCVPLAASDGERINVLFDELQTECWIGAGAKLPAARAMVALDWQINAEIGIEKSFDLCLSDVRLILPAR
ncbi:MAG: hypothetical protein ABW217_02495 [Polyangiaceae bacterium]